MKNFIKKTFGIIGSRLTYLLIGLSFSAIIIAVNAAVTITSTNATPSETLTVSKWNAVVTDLNNLNGELNSVSIGLNNLKTNGDVNANCVVYPSIPNYKTALVNCPPGKKPISGGCKSNCAPIMTNYMDGIQQHCVLLTEISGGNDGFCSGPGQGDVTAYINCCNFQ